MIRDSGQIGVAAVVVDSNPNVDGVRVAFGVLDAEIDVEVVTVFEDHANTAIYALIRAAGT